MNLICSGCERKTLFKNLDKRSRHQHRLLFPFPFSLFPFPFSLFPFPFSHFPFPISHFPFPISHFPFPISSRSPFYLAFHLSSQFFLLAFFRSQDLPNFGAFAFFSAPKYN